MDMKNKMKMKKIVFAALSISSSALFGGADVHAFSNSDFENRAKFGKVDDHVEIRESIGFNGSAGVRVRPIGNKRGSYRFESTFKPKAKQKYLFSTVRRITGRLRPHQYWQCWGKDGWCRGQNWNVNVTKLDGGWERVDVAIYFEDEEWEKGDWRFCVDAAPPDGVSAVPDSYMDVDDVRITEDDPEWHISNVWPTHNWLFNEEGHLRFHSSFLGHFIPEGGEAAYRFVLRGKDGKKLAERKLKPETPAFTVKFGKIGYEGPAKVEITLADTVSRKICGRREIEVEVRPTYKPKPGEVFITEDGDTLIDGKPYMPLGFFTSLVRDRDLKKTEDAFKKISGAGFNCVMEYWMTSLRDDLPPDYYRLCRKYGLKVLYNFSGAYKMSVDEIVQRAQKQLDFGIPLLAWYTLDEATLAHIPPLTRARKELNRLAPGYPTWQVNIRELPPYLSVADVLGGDHYLIGKHQGVLKQMNRYMSQAKACRASTMWYCPQCFNWANYDRDARNDREKYLVKDIEPTVNQMLAIAFLYASHGVKGFIFYMYDEIFRGPVPEKYAKRWEDVATVGKVMKSLEPFILSKTPIQELEVENVRGLTRAVVLTDGEGRKRVLVIGLDYENEARFTLPKECRDLKPLFGNAKPGAGGRVYYKTGRRSSELFQ